MGVAVALGEPCEEKADLLPSGGRHGFCCVCCVFTRVSRSVVSDSLRPHGLIDHQLPLSMRLSRQEYWSGFPCPSPEDLPGPGIEPGSPALHADSLPVEPQGKPAQK